MKNIKLLCLFVMMICSVSCNKDEDPVDLADKVTGIYNGSMSFGVNQLPCTTEISKNEATKVSVSISINGSNYLFGNIVVQKSGTDTYSLSYSDPTGYLNGSVTGKSLTYSIYSGLLNSMFSGSRLN